MFGAFYCVVEIQVITNYVSDSLSDLGTGNSKIKFDRDGNTGHFVVMAIQDL